jgi:hypothetical protein
MVKFYIASLLAFSDMQFVEGGQTQPGSYSESIPAFVPAESINDAAESVRTYLFERWKTTEGWHTHQANIMVLGEQQIAVIKEASAMGVIDVSEETPRTFNF